MVQWKKMLSRQIWVLTFASRIKKNPVFRWWWCHVSLTSSHTAFNLTVPAGSWDWSRLNVTAAEWIRGGIASRHGLRRARAELLIRSPRGSFCAVMYVKMPRTLSFCPVTFVLQRFCLGGRWGGSRAGPEFCRTSSGGHARLSVCRFVSIQLVGLYFRTQERTFLCCCCCCWT